MEYIELENTVYINCRVLILKTTGFINPFSLHKDTAIKLFEIIDSKISNKSVIVDMKGITNIPNYAIKDDPFKNFAIKFESYPNALSFVNCRSIRDEIYKHFKHNPEEFNFGNEYCLSYTNKQISKDDILFRYKESLDRLSSYVKKYLEDCVQPVTKTTEGAIEIDGNYYVRLSSTPLLTNFIFNARDIISEPILMIWTIIYWVNVIDESLSKIDLGVNTRIVSFSLRGSAFAGPICMLLDVANDNRITFELIDHLGPKNRIFERPNHDKYKNYNYIVIGDFIIGSTELRNAQIFTRLYGNEISKAFYLGSAISTENYKLGIEVHSLFKLSDIKPDLEYLFK